MKFNDILNQTKFSYLAKQSRVTKRKNKHILEVTKSFLIEGNVSPHLWCKIVSTAVYLINRTPSCVLNFKRPLYMLSNNCVLLCIVHLLPQIFLM